MSAEILMIDLHPGRCIVGKCGQVDHLILKCLGKQRGVLRTITNLTFSDDIPTPDIILLRASPRINILDFLKSLREKWKCSPILGLMCALRLDPLVVSDALIHGLDDFLTCPFEEINFLPRAQRLLRKSSWLPTLMGKGPNNTNPDVGSLLGKSQWFMRAQEKASRLAQSEATILISGETGTGKDLFARFIHYGSNRKEKPLVPVNCGALPDHLCENELFGHVKGAFTDALSSERGLIAEAEGGTLFLDEIGAMPLSLQAKLLRFLQFGEYRPVGSSKTLQADVRVVAVTNSDLRDLVLKGRFREDLFYRLNVLSLTVDPLRERMDDIPLLAEHFLKHFGEMQGKPNVRWSKPAMQKLLDHDWPGNVRELEGVIHQAVLLASEDILDEREVSVPTRSPPNCSFRQTKKETLRNFEKDFLLNLMRVHKGNVTHAAKAAGKERRSFQRLLQKYRVERQLFL